MVTDSFWIYTASLLLGVAGAWAAIRWGRRLALLDRPGRRSSHLRATPKGGGVGLLAAFVLGGVWFGAPAGFWIPAVVVSLVSFQNDRHELDVRLRLVIQFGAAGVFLVFVTVPGFDAVSPAVIIGLAIFYAVFIVGTANYYNFMDGINGMAAITGMVGFGLLAARGYVSEQPASFWCLSLGLAFACGGFLPFNIPGARVFMGDVGSILLGFVFACLAVIFSASVIEFVVAAGFLFPFYADELLTLIERVKAGERITRAHRRHLYQVLANEHGIAHWKVSAGYGLVQLIVGLSIWTLAGIGPVYALAATGFFTMAWYIVNRGVKERAGVFH